jgi:hypothetical protein
MIFIDGSNVYHSMRANFGRRNIEIGVFCNKLVGRRRLIRAYYYIAEVGKQEEPERYERQQKFFHEVSLIPYTELRLGRLVYNNWPSALHMKKEWIYSWQPIR